MGDTITTAFTNCTGYVGQIITLLTSNEILATIFVGGTLIPLAFSVFHRAKNAV